MGEPKFTPGTWNNCDGETIETKKARICIIAPLNLTQEESDANAALIAAAPEMYEALEFSKREFHDLHLEKYCEYIESVLKKARGEV